ncbi:hypothetical protein VINI7043_04920 [Vibrio nigripulchritudo ATCC 27043]|nr:hypothetical protein VINI7043_04920 [Vibrio nigripulchritudo ATCC 27043]
MSLFDDSKLLIETGVAVPEAIFAAEDNALRERS